MNLQDLFNPLEQVLLKVIDKNELDGMCKYALKESLVMNVNTDQSLKNIIFEFVKYLDTNELVEKFVRMSLHDSDRGYLYHFVTNNIDFLLEYEDKSISKKEIIKYKDSLLRNEDFSLILNAFDKVLGELKNVKKINLSDEIKRELIIIRNNDIPKKIRLFLLLEILISDYPIFNNKTTLDRLDYYLNTENNLNTLTGRTEQKAYLQVVVCPGALAEESILTAFLSFEKACNGQSQLSDIIPIKNGRSKKTAENAAIKFNKKLVVEQILEFIYVSLKEIERRRISGDQINAHLMIEFFVPFDYLFKKIDRWTRPASYGSMQLPLGDDYRIVFRSYERLTNVRFREPLKQRWKEPNKKLSNESFECFLRGNIPRNEIVGLFCSLQKAKSFREGLVNITLEKGIPIVVWFETEGGQESEKNILARLIQLVSQGSSLNDLHAIYDSIQEIKNEKEGYFAILYDEPNRLPHLARLFENTQENLLGVSA